MSNSCLIWFNECVLYKVTCSAVMFQFQKEVTLCVVLPMTNGICSYAVCTSIISQTWTVREWFVSILILSIQMIFILSENTTTSSIIPAMWLPPTKKCSTPISHMDCCVNSGHYVLNSAILFPGIYFLCLSTIRVLRHALFDV